MTTAFVSIFLVFKKKIIRYDKYNWKKIFDRQTSRQMNMLFYERQTGRHVLITSLAKILGI